MKLSDFDYDLPKSYIAQSPVVPRDSSQMLVYDSSEDVVEHRAFRDVLDYLNSGDVLVVNRSKVIPARILFSIEGKDVEIFRAKKVGDSVHECLVKPGKIFQEGFEFEVSNGLMGKVVAINPDGTRNIEFSKSGGDVNEALDDAGEAPFPPYITERTASFDQYQTVYSREKGSTAAPTAGLHFTEELLRKVKEKGLDVETVLLHVGLGTFQPVKVEHLQDHQMHSEGFEFTEELAAKLNKAKSEGRRIIAVGTTTVRVLESCFVDGRFVSKNGETDIFIYPGYKWNAVDSLITNFHLPKSTLIMLVASFLEHKGSSDGVSKIMELYETAKENNYRFYSFGDAMFIL
ncbi:tRNA preQ1(34) S-adenosylmethionine ribosyltransferase-isomerase QueA [Candidatus Peregrinibacteria bacterium]|jgi:S-adenosylmethionine:tRNA ribosyltransferase-isomerase|nr:tRNA preQ1(34) S-adenosylmethionine ribosyltransferase-isomerase QueA [Candidatus Peregrinibacteria bacterium]